MELPLGKAIHFQMSCIEFVFRTRLYKLITDRATRSQLFLSTPSLPSLILTFLRVFPWVRSISRYYLTQWGHSMQLSAPFLSQNFCTHELSDGRPLQRKMGQSIS